MHSAPHRPEPHFAFLSGSQCHSFAIFLSQPSVGAHPPFASLFVNDRVCHHVNGSPQTHRAHLHLLHRFLGLHVVHVVKLILAPAGLVELIVAHTAYLDWKHQEVVVSLALPRRKRIPISRVLEPTEVRGRHQRKQRRHVVRCRHEHHSLYVLNGGAVLVKVVRARPARVVVIVPKEPLPFLVVLKNRSVLFRHHCKHLLLVLFDHGLHSRCVDPSALRGPLKNSSGENQCPF